MLNLEFLTQNHTEQLQSAEKTKTTMHKSKVLRWIIAQHSAVNGVVIELRRLRMIVYRLNH